MNSPSVLKVIKPIFHALTVAASLQAALQSSFVAKFIPEKYAIAIAAASSVVSGALHFISVYWPDVAAAE